MKSPKLSNRVLLIVCVAAAVAGFACGFLCSETRLPPYSTLTELLDWARNEPRVREVHDLLLDTGGDPGDPVRGVWHPLPKRRTLEGAEKRGADLRSVGYLSGYEPSPGLEGVTVYDPERAYKGLNLITSGHAEEARLVDMEGAVVHKWSYDFARAFPEYGDVDGSKLLNPFSRDYWRRVYLYHNGDLLAIYEGFGLIKLDKDSELIWSLAARCHHDVFVDEEGIIYTLGRELRSLPEFESYGKMLEDFLLIVDPSGKVRRRISLPEAYDKSSYAPLLSRMPSIPDKLHTNSVQVLDGSQADRFHAFRRGNILISARRISVIAILDPDLERIVWALSGQWRAQHEPTMLANGNILLFDNLGHNGMSKVVEIDPLSQEIVWAYEGTPDNGFVSEVCGSCYRLANGNTLIVESTGGRAFEVTPDTRTVWEYLNPERAGKDDTLIAMLLDCVRLPADFPLDWLHDPHPSTP